jgi:hypothetical protein
MKKLVFILAITLNPTIFFAQNNQSIPMIAQNLDQSKMNKKDCVMMKNGKMLMMVSGKTMDMPAEVKLKDGSVVEKNGTVRMKDGSTKAMKNGDSVDMDGNWERMDKKP